MLLNMINRDFAVVIKLRILRQDYLGLCMWIQCNHKGPYKEVERSVRRCDNANEPIYETEIESGT